MATYKASSPAGPGRAEDQQQLEEEESILFSTPIKGAMHACMDSHTVPVVTYSTGTHIPVVTSGQVTAVCADHRQPLPIPLSIMCLAALYARHHANRAKIVALKNEIAKTAHQVAQKKNEQQALQAECVALRSKVKDSDSFLSESSSDYFDHGLSTLRYCISIQTCCR